MRCSRAVFARKLRINVRTLEKWEQGRAQAESAGGGTGAAGADVSRYTGAVGGKWVKGYIAEKSVHAVKLILVELFNLCREHFAS